MQKFIQIFLVERHKIGCSFLRQPVHYFINRINQQVHMLFQPEYIFSQMNTSNILTNTSGYLPELFLILVLKVF